MAEEKTESVKKTLAEIQGEKTVSEVKHEETKSEVVTDEKKEEKKNGTDVEKNNDEEMGKTTDNEMPVYDVSKPEEGQKEENVPSKLQGSMEEAVSTVLQEKMALKIEEKIEEHLNKEMESTKRKDPVKFLIYSLGLGLVMVWVVWTVVLVVNMRN